MAIIQEIICEVEFYSVMFDKATDMSRISQMRHGRNVREDFVRYVNARACVSTAESGSHDDKDEHITAVPVLTGDVLGQIVMNTLVDLFLDPDICVGIG